MEKILLTAFAGESNTSKLLLDHVTAKHKKILTNSFVSSGKQLIEAVQETSPDLIIAFGQKPKTACICIEIQAHKGDVIKTNFDYSRLLTSLNERNIKYEISDNAGNYLCNHVYYEGLRYIKDNNLSTMMIFIHVPGTKSFRDFDEVSQWLDHIVEEDSNIGYC